MPVLPSHEIDTLIDEKTVNDRVSALAADIDATINPQQGLVLVGLLRGSYVFLADLSRALQSPHEIDFMVASSYGNNTESSREVRILKDLDGEIHDKQVVIVEDIIDTGYTLKEVTRILKLRQPAALHIVTLLDKPERREVDVKVDWVGFRIPDQFVVGVGIDYAQQYRHLPYIGVVRHL